MMSGTKIQLDDDQKFTLMKVSYISYFFNFPTRKSSLTNRLEYRNESIIFT